MRSCEKRRTVSRSAEATALPMPPLPRTRDQALARARITPQQLRDDFRRTVLTRMMLGRTIENSFLPQQLALPYASLLLERRAGQVALIPAAARERVLDMAADQTLPLLERVNFLSIFASNLDEFFMVRVAGLKRRDQMGLSVRSADGLSPREQLRLISQRTQELSHKHALVFSDAVRPELAAQGISVVSWADLTPAEQQDLTAYFHTQVFPVLTPLAVDPAHPFPFIPNLGFSLAVELARVSDGRRLEAQRLEEAQVAAVLVGHVGVRGREVDEQRTAQQAAQSEIAAARSSRDAAIGSPREGALSQLNRNPQDFGQLLEAHVVEWEQLWRRYDVALDEEIDKRPEDLLTQLALRTHTFHTAQTLAPHMSLRDAGVPLTDDYGREMLP